MCDEKQMPFQPPALCEGGEANQPPRRKEKHKKEGNLHGRNPCLVEHQMWVIDALVRPAREGVAIRDEFLHTSGGLGSIDWSPPGAVCPRWVSTKSQDRSE